MFEKYWILLFPHYVLFGLVVALVVASAFSRNRWKAILCVAVFCGLLWTVLVFIEVVLPHSKNLW
jgi:hypothetical protein